MEAGGLLHIVSGAAASPVKVPFFPEHDEAELRTDLSRGEPTPCTARTIKSSLCRTTAAAVVTRSRNTHCLIVSLSIGCCAEPRLSLAPGFPRTCVYDFRVNDAKLLAQAGLSDAHARQLVADGGTLGWSTILSRHGYSSSDKLKGHEQDDGGESQRQEQKGDLPTATGARASRDGEDSEEDTTREYVLPRRPRAHNRGKGKEL